MKSLKNAILIVTIAVITIPTSFILGVIVGKDKIPETESGFYNIDIHQGGKVVVTTQLKNIEYNETSKELVIYGEPTHENIE